MSQSSAQVSAITPDFVNMVLLSTMSKDQTTVVEVRPEPLTGPKNFNASLWRLYLSYDRPPAAAPQSLIAKLPTADRELSERAAIFQPGLRENWFYQAGAPRSPICVPRCYYQAIDEATGQSILLLEDLAPALPGNWLKGATIPQAQLALESLARLHASWWADVGSLEIQELTNLLADDWTGEQNLVQELYDSAWPKFLSQGMVAMPDDVRHFGAAIVGNMGLIDGLIDPPGKTLAHGDYRLANILFGSHEGKAVCWVIDWEDVFFGSGMIDVSWFLVGCLPVEESQHETALLRYYHQTLVEAGVADYSWGQCYEEYRRATCSNFVQGILSATLDETASEYDLELAGAVGQRFVAAAQRLHLLELMP